MEPGHPLNLSFSCVAATLLLVERRYIKNHDNILYIFYSNIFAQMFNVLQKMNVNNRKWNSDSLICVKSFIVAVCATQCDLV